MADEPLSNRAVETIRLGHAWFNSLDRRPDFDVSSAFSEDFVCEDRKTGGVSFGLMNASEYLAALQSNWDVGRQSPSFVIHRVIAVRGDRLAAVDESVDFDDMVIHGATVWKLDSSLTRWQRIVSFDIDDVDAAVAELERMYAEIDD